MVKRQQSEPEPDALLWLADVYRLVSGDEPDEAGQWLSQLECWLVEVRQRLAEVERKRMQQAVAGE
jgi:hypothetical protein